MKIDKSIFSITFALAGVGFLLIISAQPNEALSFIGLMLITIGFGLTFGTAINLYNTLVSKSDSNEKKSETFSVK